MKVTKFKPMTFRLTIAVAKKLRAQAKTRKVSLTTIVEAALTKYL